MSQIRITKTQEIEEILKILKRRFRLLSDAEIIKMILSKFYYEETHDKGVRFMTREEEQSVGMSMEEIREDKSFKGNAKEAMEWIRK